MEFPQICTQFKVSTLSWEREKRKIITLAKVSIISWDESSELAKFSLIQSPRHVYPRAQPKSHSHGKRPKTRCGTSSLIERSKYEEQKWNLEWHLLAWLFCRKRWIEVFGHHQIFIDALPEKPLILHQSADQCWEILSFPKRCWVVWRQLWNFLLYDCQ